MARSPPPCFIKNAPHFARRSVVCLVSSLAFLVNQVDDSAVSGEKVLGGNSNSFSEIVGGSGIGSNIEAAMPLPPPSSVAPRGE